MDLAPILIVLLLLQFSQTPLAKNPPCTPSSCGIIHNISYPFRLEGDPLHCGDRRFELSCENDVAFLQLPFLDFQKYYVKDINYANSTMRLVDASINTTDICSFPTYTNIKLHSYTYGGPYELSAYPTPTSINFISCPNPLKNSNSYPSYAEISHDCNSSSSKYTYVKLGYMLAFELPYMCELDGAPMTSWPEFKDLNNVLLSEIHRSLLYGK